MKLFKYKYFVPLLIGILTSCDCLQRANGVVIDKNSKLPIDSVIVSKAFDYDSTRLDNTLYTDREGRYKFHSISGGLFSCPKFKLKFSKSGFETLEKVYQSCCTENDTILLIPR